MTNNSRLVQETVANKNDLHYFNMLSNRIRKMNETNQLRKLPQIYAKADQINKHLNNVVAEYKKKTAESELSDDEDEEPEFGELFVLSEDRINEAARKAKSQIVKPFKGDKDYYSNAYQKTRRRGMIVSKYLDEGIRDKLNEIKNSDKPFFMYDESKKQDSKRQSRNRKRNTSDNGYGKSEFQGGGSTIRFGSSSFRPGESDHSNFKLFSPETMSIPSFGSFLSKDGQYALMKSLEDIIISEIETKYPECRNRVPRTTTAQYVKLRIRRNNNDLEKSSLFGPPESSSNYQTSDYKTGSSINSFRYVNTSFLNKMDDLQYEQSEVFFLPNEIDEEEQKFLKMPDSNHELEEKLVVSKKINSGLNILDLVRKNRRKSSSRVKRPPEPSGFVRNDEEKLIVKSRVRIKGDDVIKPSLSSLKGNTKKTLRFSDQRDSTFDGVSPIQKSDSGILSRNGSAAANRLDPINSFSAWKNLWNQD